MPARRLALLVTLLALVPAVHAVGTLGRIHPDEVYQALEPAWFRVHGYGVLAWEWKVGLRNWAVPTLLSWGLRLADVLGLTHPRAYRALLALLQAGLHAAMLLAVLRHARRRLGEGGAAAPLALALVGLFGPVVLFGARPLSETLGTALFVLGAEALERAADGGARARRAALVGGTWLGLAVVARYGSAVLVLAALAWLLLRRRWAALGLACASGAGVAGALAALDWATWGAPLHSLRAYVDFNVLSDEAVRHFGAAPWHFYLAPLVAGLPAWALLALPAGARALARRQAPSLPVWSAAVYLAAVAATPHKEERFVYPALVLLAWAAAVPAARWVVRLRTAGARVAAGAVALALGLAPLATYPSYDLRGDQFRALVRTAADPETRGLLIVNEGLWGAGGFFYLGRRLPWLTCDWPHDAAFQQALARPDFNRAITFEGRALAELQAAGFRVVGTEGRETVLARP